MKMIFILLVLVFLSVILVTGCQGNWGDYPKDTKEAAAVEEVDPIFTAFKKELDIKVEVIANTISALPYSYNTFEEVANREITPLHEKYTFKFQTRELPELNKVDWIKTGTIEIEYLVGHDGISWQYNVFFENDVEPAIIESHLRKYVIKETQSE
jgi:hypothetical protein